MAWLWDFLAATFAVLAAWAGSSAPRGEGIAAALPFLICALVFGGLALRAHKRREEKAKQSWAEEYAQTIYTALAATNDLGDITALKLRIPTVLHHAYQNKIVLQRELISFAALMECANPETKLGPVILTYENLLLNKMGKRGLQMNGDQLARAAVDDVEAMIADPFKWAQRWLSEFRNDPNDDYMVASFADHCLRLWKAHQGAIENTRPR